MKPSKLRKYFALGFTTVTFVALAGVALVIARGNIITDQGLVETGSIRFNVSPNGEFEAFLNEQIQKLNNSSISNVTPGTYDLKIEKQGYTSWHQSVDIKAGLVSDVTVQLFPQDLKLEQLSKTNVDKTVFSPSHHYAYYSIVNYPLGTQVGIWKQTLQQSNIPLIEEKPLKITNLTTAIESDIVAGTYTIKPASDDSKAVLITSTATYILDATRYNEPGADNKLNVSYPVDEINWLRSPTNLLLRSGNLLIDYDLDKKSSTIITYQADKAPIYSLNGSSLLYISDNKLYKYTPGSNIAVTLENVNLPGDISAIITGYASDTNLLLKAGAKLYYLSTTESYLTELGSYSLITIAPNGRNLIVTDGKEIVSLNVNISLAFNSVATTKRSTELTDKLIASSIQWDPNSNYFVFQMSDQGSKIFSADFSGSNINALISSESLTTPAYYGLPDNNSGLIVKLFDSQNQADTSAKQANLYRLSFN